MAKRSTARGSKARTTAPARRPNPAALERAPELSVIVPTYCERTNIPLLVERLRKTLAGRRWEIIFVDDNSPDGTADEARRIGAADARVRCIRRIGRRGLAGACIEGMLASQADYVAVMDADLQHDETRLPVMLDMLVRGDADVVAASRFLGGVATGGLSRRRTALSRWTIAVTHVLLAKDLTDPLSGFFMLRRATVEGLAPQLSSQGFKILFDILATERGALRVVEIPGRFEGRQHGESKLGANIALEFFGLMLSKLTNDAVSIRFLMFCLVGLTGIGVHMIALALLHATPVVSFGVQQSVATVLVIAWNFVLNNVFTYSDQRLTGWRFVTGLVRFELVCAVGAISNIGIASLIYSQDRNWWIAGLAGAVMGAVWNYVVSAALVWRTR